MAARRYYTALRSLPSMPLLRREAPPVWEELWPSLHACSLAACCYLRVSTTYLPLPHSPPPACPPLALIRRVGFASVQTSDLKDAARRSDSRTFAQLRGELAVVRVAGVRVDGAQASDLDCQCLSASVALPQSQVTPARATRRAGPGGAHAASPLRPRAPRSRAIGRAPRAPPGRPIARC